MDRKLTHWLLSGSQANSLHVVMALIANVFYSMIKKIKMDAHVHTLHPHKQPLNPHPLPQQRVVGQREGNTKASRVSEGGYRQKIRGGGCNR